MFVSIFNIDAAVIKEKGKSAPSEKGKKKSNLRLIYILIELDRG